MDLSPLDFKLLSDLNNKMFPKRHPKLGSTSRPQIDLDGFHKGMVPSIKLFFHNAKSGDLLTAVSNLYRIHY